MKKKSLSQSGVTFEEMYAYADFLVCWDEYKEETTYSEEEYFAKLKHYLKAMASHHNL